MTEDNAAEDPLLGQTLAGFVLRERLGEGASATVYRGESTTHASIIRAIKVIHEDKQRKVKLLNRFVEEARLLAKLVHPNIVTFYHATNDRGRLVMVLEFLEGSTLRTHLNSWRANDEHPPLDSVLEILCQASDGVAFAHGGGSSAGVSSSQRRDVVIHRDLKPDNLFVIRTSSDEVQTKVLDFGIAAAFDDVDRQAWTTTGVTAQGTGAYIAPELWKGKELPTPRVDVYALGITLFECVTGSHPFMQPGEPPKGAMQFAMAHCTEPLPALRQGRPGVPESLEEIVKKATAKEPSARYPTAKEFGEALRAVQRELALAKRPRVAAHVEVAHGSSDVGGIRSDIPLGKPPKIEPTPPTKLPQPAEPDPTRPRSRWWMMASALAVVVGMIVAAVVWPKKPGNDVSMNSGAGSASASASAAASAPAPSASFVAASVPSASASQCPEGMRLIPAGMFKMGSETGPDDEKGGKPERVEAFCMDITEVTAEAYAECVKTNKCKPAPTTVQWAGVSAADAAFWGQFCNANRTGREKYPINCVDWEMAKTYCTNRASRLPPDRLPTEREWEYAARGTDGRKYPWDPKLGEPRKGLLNACGSECVTMLKSKGQTLWTTPMYKEDDGFPDTAPVGSFPEGKSFYELLDMAGNVWEWTDSLYTTNYNSKPDNKSELRVLRGGSWNNDEASIVRASDRFRFAPTARSNDVGFRCARTPL